MNIAVLCDGAGLARLGLEQAGHTCTGYELDPAKHYLSRFVGSGRCVLADVRNIDLSGYDAAWISPPCQHRSQGRTQGLPVSIYSENLLDWALSLSSPSIRWIENVLSFDTTENIWGSVWNAAQFTPIPLQCRNRIIGGTYPPPTVYRSYQRRYTGVCPAITATEYKGCASDSRRASRHYQRKLTLEECAYHQGFTIPPEWYTVPDGYTPARWRNNLYEAIGNGVPVYMVRAFGLAAYGKSATIQHARTSKLHAYQLEMTTALQTV